MNTIKALAGKGQFFLLVPSVVNDLLFLFPLVSMKLERGSSERENSQNYIHSLQRTLSAKQIRIN